MVEIADTYKLQQTSYLIMTIFITFMTILITLELDIQDGDQCKSNRELKIRTNRSIVCQHL